MVIKNNESINFQFLGILFDLETVGEFDLSYV